MCKMVRMSFVERLNTMFCRTTVKVEQVEVGANQDEYRLWFANEKLKQAVIFADGQEARLVRIKARAASLLGWAIGLTTVVTPLSFHNRLITWAVLPAAVFLLSGLTCVYVLFTTNWCSQGYMPHEMKHWTFKNELQVVENKLREIDDALIFNEKTIVRHSHAMKVAWLLFAIGPLALLLTAFCGFNSYFCSRNSGGNSSNATVLGVGLVAG